jgi:RNA polymerase sigma-70 factor, ECF subfamily
MMGPDCIRRSTLWARTKVADCQDPRSIELPEPEAIRRAQQGDAAAFERIYRLHCRRVYALCLRIVRNPAEAEDLTQDAFLLVFRKLHTFRGESAFPTWLYRLAFNVVLMHLRKKNLPQASQEKPPETGDVSNKPSKEVGGSDSRLSGLIDRINLERALGQLPLLLRTIFVLHDIQGYKHREIARMLDCSVGTSKGQLHRARVQLRNLLRDYLASFPLISGTACEKPALLFP